MLKSYGKISRQEAFREIKSCRPYIRTPYKPQVQSKPKPKTQQNLYFPLTKFLSEVDLFVGRCDQERIFYINSVAQREFIVKEQEDILQKQLDDIIYKQAQMVFQIEFQPPEINNDDQIEVSKLVQKFNSLLDQIRQQQQALEFHVTSRNIYKLISTELKENINKLTQKRTIVNTNIQLDKQHNDGFSCVFKALSNVFITQHENIFESMQIDGNENLINKLLLEAIKSLRRTLDIPIINLTPHQVKQEFMRINQKFTEDNNLQNLTEEFLQKEMEFELESFHEAQYIVELQNVLNTKQTQIQKIQKIDLKSAQTLLISLDTQFYTLEHSISLLASQIGCPGPTGSEEVTMKLIKKIYSKTEEIIQTYFSLDPAELRRARIKWISDKEKSVLVQKRFYSRDVKTAEVPVRFRKDMVMSRSPKKKTQQWKADKLEVMARIKEGDKNTFFDQ